MLRSCRAARADGDYDFWFTRLMYDSGDWDVDQRMPSNMITSLIDYTTLRVDPKEHVLRAGRPEDADGAVLLPRRAQAGRVQPGTSAATSSATCATAASCFVDDCNHDIDGLFAKSFEAQMAAIFGAEGAEEAAEQPRAVPQLLQVQDGPPATAFELNGWGDDLVHDYLKGIEIDGRLGVLYSNKDYGCEWDYDWRNKRFLAEDNTKFAVNIVMYALTA